MPVIEVVENPRRRRRRRLSAAQKKAGFGGRRAMGGSRRRTRRNPVQATWTNPRRRRRARPSRRRRHYSRRRNPSFGLGGFGRYFAVDLALPFAAGMASNHFTPMVIQKVWPNMPQDGITGALVRTGGTFVLSAGVFGYLLKMRRFATLMMAGAIGYELGRLVIPYLQDAFGTSRYVTEDELARAGMNTYVTSAGTMAPSLTPGADVVSLAA